MGINHQERVDPQHSFKGHRVNLSCSSKLSFTFLIGSCCNCLVNPDNFIIHQVMELVMKLDDQIQITRHCPSKQFVHFSFLCMVMSIISRGAGEYLLMVSTGDQFGGNVLSKPC